MHQGSVLQGPPPSAMQQSLRQPTYEGSLFQLPFAGTPPMPAQQPHPMATPPAGSPYNQYPPSYAQVPGGYQSQGQPVGTTWNTPPVTYQGGVAPAARPAPYETVGGAKDVGPPTVDRSTKPDSIKALSTGWGGKWSPPQPINCVYVIDDHYLINLTWGSHILYTFQ